MVKKIKGSINWNKMFWLYMLAFVAFSLIKILPNYKRGDIIQILIQLVATALRVIQLHAFATEYHRF